ncbi:peptidase M48 [Haloferula helveola]|uniref:Peptidase M48 n=1 Tax=Haloferula helveola TaxID=490095 RepID=A0ABM7RF62_9BACT|nr:peptidase M48 [Haloferula helveola]
MNRQQYNELVTKIERRYEGRPVPLLRKALFYVWFSYGYLALVLIVSVTVLAGLVALVIFKPNYATIKLGLIIGVVFGALFLSIVKGLWVKMSPPDGIPLKKQDAPELFALLDQLREQVAPVKFNSVLVNGDFNAAVVQVPRLGIFGFYRSYLLLGLPLLQTLGTDEFKAVLAHEFAHLSNRDGSSGSWLYRIRRSWEQMISNVAESGGRGSFALRPFVSWFWPRFNAHAFVLSRLQEYRADALGAEFAGTEAMGRALQRIELRGRWLEESVWPDVFRRVNHESAAPGEVFQFLATRSSEEIPADQSSEWLEHAYLRPTDHSDTHPALLDRLRSLDAVPPEIGQGVYKDLPPVGKTAAAELLGGREKDLMESLSKDWQTGMAIPWKARHDEVRKIRSELGPEEEVETAEDAWKWAAAMMDIEDDGAAMPWIERVLGMDPQHVGARFVKGRHLLTQGNADGVSLLEEVMQEDRGLGMEVLGLLHGHYTRTGNVEELKEITRRADNLDEFYEIAERERQGVNKSDTLKPHSLSPDMIRRCAKIFEGEESIAEVHVAGKEVEHMKNVPMHAVSLNLTGSFFKLKSGNADQELVNRVVEALPIEGTFLVFVNHKDQKWLGKRVAEQPGSLIYPVPE